MEDGAIAAGAIAAGVVADGVDGVTVAGDAGGEAAAFILAYRIYGWGIIRATAIIIAVHYYYGGYGWRHWGCRGWRHRGYWRGHRGWRGGWRGGHRGWRGGHWGHHRR